MSNYEPRGRRVVDPKPVRLCHESGNKPLSDIDAAWETMNKAKSALRRTEFNLRETEKPPIADYSRTSSIPVDRIPKYSFDKLDVAQQVVVDKYGRTSHMRAKISDSKRKVTRSEHKYQEDRRDIEKVELRKRSPLRESNTMCSTEVCSSSHARSALRAKMEESSGVSSLVDKYRQKYKVTDHNFDELFSRERSSDMTDNASTNVTSASAVQNTEVNFLNNFSIRDVGSTFPESKFTKVSVTVPSARTYSTHSKSHSDRPITTGHEGLPISGILSNRVKDSRGSASVGSDSGSIGNQMKAAGKHIDPKNDAGLAKVREMILKQRAAVPGQEKDEHVDTLPEVPQRALHQQDEPIVGHKYDIFVDEPPPLPVRKVATGLKTPSYKGFSESETRYQSSSKQNRVPDGRRKKSKQLFKPSQPLQPQLQPAAQPPIPKRDPREHRKIAEKSEEPRKMTRVVAQKRPAKSEVITTHSWRQGQKAILKELGPHKIAKLQYSPPTSDRDPPRTESHTRDEHRPRSHGHTSRRSEPDKPTISAEAQSVLADLNADQSDEDMEAELKRDRHRSSRRRRAKTPEQDASEKLVKTRHYDSNEVRRYIAKQRTERKRKQQEQDENKKKSEEAKNKMLEELYKKQKAGAKVAQSKSDGIQFKLDPPEAKHKSSSESDKENWSNPSSGSSTLTEASLDKDQKQATIPVTQPAIPQRPSKDINTEILLKKYLGDSTSNSHQVFPSSRSDVGAKAGVLDPEAHLKAEEIVKKLTKESGLSVNDIVNKYANQAQAIRSAYSHSEPHPGASTIPPPVSIVPTEPARPSKGSYARIDRIQAIKNTANSLQTRLHLEAKRLTTADRWAQPREETEFVSRYQRMAGTADNVFDGSVPGVQNLHATAYRAEDEGTKTRAATKIQAAFRGHNVRQSLSWGSPEQKTVGRKNNAVMSRESRVSDSDGLSDSTLTEDSVNDDGDNKEYCDLPPYIPARGIKPSKPVPRWDQSQSQADPYNFFSVYSRKQNTIHKPRIPTPPMSDDDEEMRKLTEPPPPPPIPVVPILSKKRGKPRAKSPVSDVSERTSSIEEDMEYEDDFTTSHKSISRSHKSQRSGPRPVERRSGDGMARDEEDDDSINRTLTESTNSELQNSLGEAGERSLVLSSKAKVTSGDKDSDWSDVSSLTDESEAGYHNMGNKYKSPYAAPGYRGHEISPGVLGHRMAVELNMLESMEESLRQLTDVERTRAVAMSQQETVSLAQILKARQQTHNHDMAELQNKTQKELQLQESQQRAAQAAEAISRARLDPTVSLEESTRKLIETQNQAAKATAQAAKHMAGHVAPKHDHSTQYSLQEQSQYSRTDASAGYSRNEDATLSYGSDSYESSYTKSSKNVMKTNKSNGEDISSADVKTADDMSKSTASTVKTASVTLASDLSIGDGKSADSSIQTESGAKDEADFSKTESVPEEIGSEREKTKLGDLCNKKMVRPNIDYTVDFDTEEELECSLREVLPSEGQRKKLKHQTSRDLSFMSEDGILPAEEPVSSRRLSFEDDSFVRFNIDMVRQYMRDEEIREKHQQALLKLREQALVEKTKAELAWVDQQKQQTRSKGADDAFPRLKQKQQGIIRRWKQEQAELKRLQEAQKAASRKRLLMFKESQEIVKMQKSTQQVRNKLKDSGATSNVSLPLAVSDIPTEDEMSIQLEEGSESQPTSPNKEKSDYDSFHKLKLKLDYKYLTKREKKLQQRREKAEELMAWKCRLDEEEARISEIEREVASLEKIKRDTKQKQNESDQSYEMIEGPDTLQLTTPRTPRADPESIQESIYSEKTDMVRSSKSGYSSIPEEMSSRKSEYSSISEDISTKTPSTVRKSGHTSITEQISAAPSTVRTRSRLNMASDASIQEETHDDAETNVSAQDDYTNETFESEATQTQTQTNASKRALPSTQPAKNKLAKYAKENGFGIGSVSPNNNNIRKNSESESEDSFSVAPSETSDVSDVEARIRTLSDELKRRKFEAERLKHKHQRRQKEKLKQKEEYLKKQIENYDSYISHVKTELNHGSESPERHGSPVRPQIKPQSHAITRTTDRPKSVDRGQHELDLSSKTSAAPPIPPRTKPETQPKSKSPDSVKESTKQSQSTSQVEDTGKSITEDISEDVSSAHTAITERSELKLNLQEKEDEKVSVVAPGSARENYMDTARSIEEIPEDFTVPTETSQHDSPRLEDLDKRDKTKVEKPKLVSAHSDTAKSVVSEYTEDQSEASETSKTSMSESYTRSDRSKTYTDDYSDDTSATISTKSPRSKIQSERSMAQISKVVSLERSVKSQVDEIEESVHTQDDISEALSEIHSDDESKSSEALFKITESPKAAVVDLLKGINLGDRVLANGKPGTLRLKDFVKFSPGFHAGVELDKPVGDSDGAVDGVSYFRCRPLHGLIVPAENVCRLERDAEELLIEDRDEAVSQASQDNLDKDIDQIISSASDAVEGFLTKHPDVTQVNIEDVEKSAENGNEDWEEEITNIQPDLVSQSDDEDYTKPKSLIEELQEAEREEKENVPAKKDKGYEEATELAVQNLVNEAISQMMTIRTRKRTSSQESSGDEKAEDVPNQKEDTGESEERPEEMQRPESPLGYRSEDKFNRELEDDDLYNFDNDGDDPWNDDDLGFGIPGKPSPPYPDQSGSFSSDELKLDLNKLNEPIKPEEICFIVPHKEDEVCRLVANVIDVFWERRRYGESWDNVTPPATYFDDNDKGADVESHSKFVYKKLVFDLTAQMLLDMYREEEEVIEVPPYMKQRLPRRKYHKHQSPPTTVDSLKPIVETHILQTLGLGPKGRADRAQTRKWATRKKKDRVDQILVQELREEEPQWVAYDEDELAVKMQLTNTLFESLLADTAMALQPALSRWSENTS